MKLDGLELDFGYKNRINHITTYSGYSFINLTEENVEINIFTS